MDNATKTNTDSTPTGWWDDPDPERALEAYRKQCHGAYARHDFASAKKLIPRPSGKKALALDYGCGGGTLSLYLAGLGYHTIASDVSACSLAACRLHAEKEHCANKITFVQNKPPDYWAGIPQQLDLVIAKDVIEHIKEDQLFLTDVASHLNKGGHLVLITQNKKSWNYAIEAPRMRALDPSWCGWHPTEHVRFYDKKHLEQILMAAGLRPEAWRSVYLIPYRTFIGPVSKKLRNVTHKLLGEDVFYWPERMLSGCWPFNGWGWSLQVRAVKQ